MKKVAYELIKLAKSLTALEFDTKEQMEKYKKEHDVRKDTKLTVKQQKEETSKKIEPVRTVKKFDVDTEEGNEEFCKALLDFWGSDEDKETASSEYGGNANDFWVDNIGRYDGIIPEMVDWKNGRIRSDGKVSFTYNGYAPGADMDFDGGWHGELSKMFQETDEFKQLQKDNPGIKIEFSWEDVDCTNEDGSENKELSKKMTGLYENFCDDTRFVDTFPENGATNSCICNYHSGDVEINCDDLYGDLPVHENSSGHKYISMRDRK